MARRSLLEIPSGVQCFFGDEARLRREVEQRVVEVFRGWSYEEIVLPLFDFDDVFTRGGSTHSATGGTYRFIGRDGEVMALRSDFTALVAKVVVSRFTSVEPPLRLFYSGEVLRYQPPRAGQREELFQVGLEHLGGGLDADLEVLLVALEALDALGAEDARITLGHVGIALGLLDDELATEQERDAALEALRRQDRGALRSALGAGRARALCELIGLTGGVEALDRASEIVRGARAVSGLERLSRLLDALAGLGKAERFQVDVGEARGFDYYTGMVFEIHVPDAGLEVGGGGRYDSLVARFGHDIPAVGFYLSLDRLAEVLVKRGWNAPLSAARDVAELREALSVRSRGERVRVRVRRGASSGSDRGAKPS
jgi:ATP phosphoribosyltransferase regulatory subunit